MALLVWLPLNGNLNNLGLRNVSVVNTGTTIDNNGKIGKCYTCTTTLYMEITNLDFSSLSSCSISFWLKVTAKGGSGWLPFAGLSTSYYIMATSNGTGAFYHNNAGSGQKIYKDGVLSTTPGALNEWHHYCITGANLSTWTKFYINKYGSGWNFAGSINDIRIYDHCLSPKEVKEISKGLVLHYKLDYNYNSSFLPVLIFYDYIESSGIQWINTGVNPTLNTDLEMRASLVSVRSGSNIPHFVYTLGSSNARYGFITQSNRVFRFDFSTNMYTISSLSLTLGQIYNFSISKGVSVNGTSYKSNLTATFTIDKPITLFAPNYQGTVNVSNYSASMRLYSCKIYDNEVLIRDFIPCNYNNLIGLWERVEGRFYGNQGSGLFTAGNVISGDSESMLEMLNTEYDCSGYGNNATIVGDINIDSVSPRYSSATKFTETTSKVKISDINTLGFSDSYTFIWWGKINNFSDKMFWGFSDGIRLNGIHNGNLWNTGDGRNNPLYIPGTTTQVTAPSVNIWHHFAMVGNGTTCLVYLDGVLWGLAKTYKSISGTTIYLNGWDASGSYATDDIYISDFRIYATALSEEDVKELYNTSAMISDHSDMYGYQLEELPEVYNNLGLITYTDSIVVSDDTGYSDTTAHYTSSFSYSRKFTSTNWGTIILPVALDYEDWADNFVIAEISGVNVVLDNGELSSFSVQRETLGEGSTTLPNKPYLIQPKVADSLALLVISKNNCIVYPANPGLIEIVNGNYSFKFIGTYTNIAAPNLLGKYYMTGSQWLKGSTRTSISPMRFYLEVDNYTGNESSLFTEITKLGIIKTGLFNEIQNQDVSIGKDPYKDEYIIANQLIEI